MCPYKSGVKALKSVHSALASQLSLNQEPRQSQAGYGGAGTCRAPATKVETVLAEVSKYPEFMPYRKESRPLASDDQLWYVLLNPPIVGERDCTIRVHHESRKRENGATAYYWHWELANAEGPSPRPGVNRVNINEGSWLLESMGNRTTATYILYTDGGDIPAFLANKGSDQIGVKISSEDRYQRRNSSSNPLCRYVSPAPPLYNENDHHYVTYSVDEMVSIERYECVKQNSLLTFSRDSMATTAYLRVSTGTQSPPSSCKSRSQRRPSPRLSASASHHSPLYQDKAVTPTPLKDIFTPIWAGPLNGQRFKYSATAEYSQLEEVPPFGLAKKHSSAALRKGRSMLFLPRLLPQELPSYDPQDVMLRPLIPGNMEGIASGGLGARGRMGFSASSISVRAYRPL
jgi:hypothetical protein